VCIHIYLNHEEAFEFVKPYLDRALSSQYVAGDVMLMNDLLLIRDRFNDPIKLKIASPDAVPGRWQPDLKPFLA
jgi:hypothetical protein